MARVWSTEEASIGPSAARGPMDHLMRAGLAGLAALAPDGTVLSREGSLSAWLPAVGRPCFESPLLFGLDEALVELRDAAQTADPLILPGVRLADGSCARRCHVLISWDPVAAEYGIITMIDQVDRPIDHWVSQQKREQRLLEERLIGASREIERMNEDLRQFSSIAAHELQAPLRQIASFSGLLRNLLREDTPAHAFECLDTIESCAGRLTRMIVGLLNHARLSSGEFTFEPVDLNDVVAEACRNLADDIASCDATVTIGALPTCDGSSVLLVNLFQNLIANSLRYRYGERAPHIVIAMVEGAQGEAGIAVSDNGIGVPAQYADAIFSSFVRVPQSRRIANGVGLGLSIGRRIAELHGWRLDLDTSYVAGAKFQIRTGPLEPSRSPRTAIGAFGRGGDLR